MGLYIKNNSVNLRKCVEEIYAKIFEGAKFPYDFEVYKKAECLNERPSNIRIQSVDLMGNSIQTTEQIQIKQNNLMASLEYKH